MQSPLPLNPKVITEVIAEEGLKAYLVGFDFGKYRWQPFVDEVSDALIEFAYGLPKSSINRTRQSRDLLKKTAKAIYEIPEFAEVASIYLKGKCLKDNDQRHFLRKGEFGELLLHLLLTDYSNTIPLISKIYLKDENNAIVHGYDGVHIEPITQTLWLGESKLYFEGQAGIDALLDDLSSHFSEDFMRKEFLTISKRIPEGEVIPNRDHWINLLNEKQKLEYDSEQKGDFKVAYEKEIRYLQTHFDRHFKHDWKESMQVILLLFPVKCKNAFVSRMHQRLYHMQRI